MKIIEACLKPYNNKDHHTNGYADGKTGNIDKGISFVPQETAQGDLQIIFEHGMTVFAL